MSTATWTEERIAQLRNYVINGLTCSQIAAEIGVTRNAVIGKIHRLGISPGRPAGASSRSSPPRVGRPRTSPHRKLFRLIYAEAPGVTADGATLEAAPVASAQPCSLLEITPGKCRWPVGDPASGDFVFCGNQAAEGFSYCPGHARMAYRVPVRRRA